jgi:hypothetical protein
MQHENFHYNGALIDLSHLGQTSADFNWNSPIGKQTYRVWLRYSNHCYSRELDNGEAQPEDAYVVETAPKLRVYCPDRCSHTERLVGMMGALFEKPTSKVSLTHDKNWTTFQLYLPPEGGGQHRYCAFFRVKNSAEQPEDPTLHFLDMHVESAYVRTNMVRTVRSCPFGMVAHMTKHQISYF